MTEEVQLEISNMVDRRCGVVVRSAVAGTARGSFDAHAVWRRVHEVKQTVWAGVGAEQGTPAWWR